MNGGPTRRIQQKVWRIRGLRFERPRSEQERPRLEARASAPDFWKDQADAQKVLQRRRRLEQDRDLLMSLKKQGDDLAVLMEWVDAGETMDRELAQALDTLEQEVQAGEIKKMLVG